MHCADLRVGVRQPVRCQHQPGKLEPPRFPASTHPPAACAPHRRATSAAGRRPAQATFLSSQQPAPPALQGCQWDAVAEKCSMIFTSEGFHAAASQRLLCADGQMGAITTCGMVRSP